MVLVEIYIGNPDTQSSYSGNVLLSQSMEYTRRKIRQTLLFRERNLRFCPSTAPFRGDFIRRKKYIPKGGWVQNPDLVMSEKSFAALSLNCSWKSAAATACRQIAAFCSNLNGARDQLQRHRRSSSRIGKAESTLTRWWIKICWSRTRFCCPNDDCAVLLYCSNTLSLSPGKNTNMRSWLWLGFVERQSSDLVKSDGRECWPKGLTTGNVKLSQNLTSRRLKLVKQMLSEGLTLNH